MPFFLHKPHSGGRVRGSTKSSGFTLIELLIVVAIIGILASVIGANYVDAVQRAGKAACQQNLRTLHTALISYKTDYNQFPLADGVADTRARSDKTEWGCGPAANGYWSGITLLLDEYGYCSEENMYCPILQRHYSQAIEAHSTCQDTDYSGDTLPQWRFLRYAYNHSAQDVGGAFGGEHNIEQVGGKDVWLLRCLHVDVGEYDPERDIRFPIRVGEDEHNPNIVWYGEFELTLGGEIRMRPVVAKPRR